MRQIRGGGAMAGEVWVVPAEQGRLRHQDPVPSGEASLLGDKAVSPDVPRTQAMRALAGIADLRARDMEALSVLGRVIHDAPGAVAIRAAEMLGDLAQGDPAAAAVFEAAIASLPASPGLAKAIEVGLASSDERLAATAARRLSDCTALAVHRLMPFVCGRVWDDPVLASDHAFRLVEIGWDHLRNGWGEPVHVATAMADADCVIRRMAARERGVTPVFEPFSELKAWGRKAAETVMRALSEPTGCGEGILS